MKLIELLKSGGNSKRIFSKTKFSHLLSNSVTKQCPKQKYSVALSTFFSFEASSGVGWEGKIKGGYKWTFGGENKWTGSLEGRVTYGGIGATTKFGGEIEGSLEVPLGKIES